MNEGQKKFHDFILERVDEKNTQTAENMLAESFQKQADGTFDKEYLMAFIPKMLGLIKEEARDEVQQVMKNFQNR